MLDGTASDPELVGEALAMLMAADRPAPHHAVGDGIDDLLALGAQPVEVREAAIGQLIADAG